MGQLHLLLAALVLLSPGRQSSYHNLLHHLSRELEFEYALLLGNSDPTWLEILWQLPVSVLQIEEHSSPNYNLLENQSYNVLTIAFVNDAPEAVLGNLYRHLRMLNTRPVLLAIKNMTVRVNLLLQWCWNHQLLNVVAIGPDFEESLIVYSYTPFPILQFIERSLDNSSVIFEQRLENLHGYRIPIALGGSSPRLIVYRGLDGKLIFSGPVGNFMKSFEQRYNCRLVQPYPFDESAIPPARDLIAAVRNGSVQIALGAIHPQLPYTGFSYPFELMSWCLMMPVPEEVPPSQLYSMVFSPLAFGVTIVAMVLISLILSIALRLHGYRVSFSEYVLHDSCLRGVLSQSFYEVLRPPALIRAMYLVICLLGLLITSWYNSYFSTFVTRAPRLPRLSSYESIKQSSLKVVIWKPEYEMLLLLSENMQKYSSIFQLHEDYQEFLHLRDSFDSRYGYMMPMEKWSLMKEQQRVFSSPLFSLQDDLCVFHTVPIVFPIVSNSIFRKPFDRHILEVAATGLLSRWRDMSFTEMIKAGKLSLEDRGHPKEFRAMKVEDLLQIWRFVGWMFGLATMVFILELVCFWRHRMWQNMKYIFCFGKPKKNLS
ncbi:uncharacterized protein LOC26526307 [Drosophila erecta]|uniref:uncharacterized protein LOC26526307 n=1 Tax=Drosophila erecta TaxID=7220 RepID=UPI000732B716|nr:uncharacterized protein LOC26526307 [Drosophila erecta]KQS52439.1 uncharacterized protein Dere_GG26483 [Drosophila erecta]